MVADGIISDILINISKKRGVDVGSTMDIMNAFYRGLQHTIAERKADVIKIPYFGKFMYNADYKKKREKAILEFNELKFGKAE